MAYLLILLLCVIFIITKLRWFVGLGFLSYILLIVTGVI